MTMTPTAPWIPAGTIVATARSIGDEPTLISQLVCNFH